MSHLVVNGKDGKEIHYSGSQFDGLENIGTHHLCIKTGSGLNDIKKYALTTTPLNDKYKGLRMRIPDNAGANSGRDTYIAQRYSVSESTSSSKTYTVSRVSNYVSSTTLRTASSSKLSTGTATRIDTQHPVYYGTYPLRHFERLPIVVGTQTSQTGIELLTEPFILASSATTFYTSSNVRYTAYFPDAFRTTQYEVYEITSSKTSSISNYVTSKILSTESSSKLSTGNATRSSIYNTSSSASTTISKLTHNVNQ